MAIDQTPRSSSPVIGSVEEYTSVLMAAGAAILAIVVVAIFVALVRRRRRERSMHAPLPLIPFSPNRAAGPPRPDGTLPPVSAPVIDRRSATTPEWSSPISPPRPSQSQSSFAPPADATRVATPVPGSTSSALAGTARPNEMVAGDAVDG